MAVGKGSMARASKAAGKKKAEMIEEKVKIPRKSTTRKPRTKKNVEEVSQEIQPEQEEIAVDVEKKQKIGISIGEEMPIYFY